MWLGMVTVGSAATGAGWGGGGAAATAMGTTGATP